jgi:hypothetical protein
MKKIIVMMALLLSAAGNIVFAIDDNKISAHVKRTFVREFPGASFERWDKLENEGLYIVRFVYKEEALLSYIDDDGELVATVRLIEPKILPFVVSETLARKYKGYRISKAEEFITKNDVSYLFTLSSERTEVYVRIYSSGSNYEIKKRKRKPAAGNPLL